MKKGCKKIEEKRVKIIYSKEDQDFKIIEGCVDLGYLGIYSTEQMSINFNWEYYKNKFWNEEDSWWYKR